MQRTDYIPQRIVSLQPSATLTLRDLGLLERVVARTKYCVDVCPEINKKSRIIVADSWSAQAEQILAAHPDLVLASVPYQPQAVGEILKTGVRFLGLAPRTLSDIYMDIAVIAGLMGVAERGTELIAQMKECIDRVRQTSASLPPLKVFCEEWGKPIIASESWVAELVEAAGGTFLGQPGKAVTEDAVIASQPDVLVAAWCGAGDRVPLEKIVKERGWEALPSVQNSRVFCIKDELLNTPASCLVEGLHAIAWALHPEQFPRPAGIRQISSLENGALG